jgi:hypothetical protein
VSDGKNERTERGITDLCGTSIPVCGTVIELPQD